MGIKRSTLYYQRKINIHKRQKELKIRKKIADISREHPYYGYRRITAQLRRDKLIVNHKKVLKMMKDRFYEETNLGKINEILYDCLIEYNFYRPHRSLNLLTPIEYCNKLKNRDVSMVQMYWTQT